MQRWPVSEESCAWLARMALSISLCLLCTKWEQWHLPPS